MKQSQLVGTWRITSDSRNYLPANQAKLDVYITLEADGTFVSSAFPDIYPEDGSDSEVFAQSKERNTEPGSGTWSLIKQDGDQLVDLRYEGDVGESLYVSNLHTPTIYYFNGDPDSGKRIEFHKQKS